MGVGTGAILHATPTPNPHTGSTQADPTHGMGETSQTHPNGMSQTSQTQTHGTGATSRQQTQPRPTDPDRSLLRPGEVRGYECSVTARRSQKSPPLPGSAIGGRTRAQPPPPGPGPGGLGPEPAGGGGFNAHWGGWGGPRGRPTRRGLRGGRGGGGGLLVWGAPWGSCGGGFRYSAVLFDR